MNRKSPFTIEEESISGHRVITLRNTTTGEFLSTLPESGARIRELWLRNGHEIISVLRRIDNPCSKNRDDIFTNAKLSPFAGRVKGGKYVFNKASYVLPVNYPEEGNACHGLLYAKRFSVAKKVTGSDRAECSFAYEYQREDQGYPFTYSIEVNYVLTRQEGFICATRILNCSHLTMPLSDGWHHYYDLGEDVDGLRLRLEVSDVVELDSHNVPTGKKTPFHDYDMPERIGGKKFDSCFRVAGHNGKAVTQLISDNRNITINIWQETGEDKFAYLVIYTPPDRKTIAIEPITSNINSLNTGDGLIFLSPNQEYKSSFGIRCGE